MKTYHINRSRELTFQNPLVRKKKPRVSKIQWEASPEQHRWLKAEARRRSLTVVKLIKLALHEYEVRLPLAAIDTLPKVETPMNIGRPTIND